MAAPTNPQYIAQSNAALGFVLPAYQSSQNTGCPPNLREISSSFTSVIVPMGINNPVDTGSSIWVVKPTDNTQHTYYSFFTKVTALGGSTQFFGPYNLQVGCIPTSVVFTDNPSFVNSVSLFVGDSTANVYTFNQPSSSRAWCTIKTNKIRNTDGSVWSGSTQITEA